MRVEYDLKLTDHVAFSLLHVFFSVTMQGFMVLACVWFYSGLKATDGVAVNVVLTVLVYLFGWLVQAVFTVVYLAAGKSRTLYTHHIVEIHDDAFIVENKFSRCHYFWNGIVKVVLL